MTAARCGIALAVAAALAAGGCDVWRDEDTVHTAVLADGTYRVAHAFGHDPADEPELSAIVATLDRAAGELVLTMRDGSRRTLGFTPRPRAQWRGDCATMSSHFEDEVADLAPAPLQLASISLATPLAYAKCSPTRMILAGDLVETGPALVLDHE